MDMSFFDFPGELWTSFLMKFFFKKNKNNKQQDHISSQFKNNEKRDFFKKIKFVFLKKGQYLEILRFGDFLSQDHKKMISFFK